MQFGTPPSPPPFFFHKKGGGGLIELSKKISAGIITTHTREREGRSFFLKKKIFLLPAGKRDAAKISHTNIRQTQGGRGGGREESRKKENQNSDWAMGNKTHTKKREAITSLFCQHGFSSPTFAWPGKKQQKTKKSYDNKNGDRKKSGGFFCISGTKGLRKIEIWNFDDRCRRRRHDLLKSTLLIRKEFSFFFPPILKVGQVSSTPTQLATKFSLDVEEGSSCLSCSMTSGYMMKPLPPLLCQRKRRGGGRKEEILATGERPKKMEK